MFSGCYIHSLIDYAVRLAPKMYSQRVICETSDGTAPLEEPGKFLAMQGCRTAAPFQSLDRMIRSTKIPSSFFEFFT